LQFWQSAARHHPALIRSVKNRTPKPFFISNSFHPVRYLRLQKINRAGNISFNLSQTEVEGIDAFISDIRVRHRCDVPLDAGNFTIPGMQTSVKYAAVRTLFGINMQEFQRVGDSPGQDVRNSASKN